MVSLLLKGIELRENSFRALLPETCEVSRFSVSSLFTNTLRDRIWWTSTGDALPEPEPESEEVEGGISSFIHLFSLRERVVVEA